MAAAYGELSRDKNGLTPEEILAARSETLPAEVAAVEAMIGELEAVVRLRPHFADARRHLANRYVRLFNLRQETADNPMPLTQVRDAAVQSQFPTATALREWLGRAVGPNAELAYRAWLHARAAAELAPLEGEPYVRLAELCFLQGQGFAETDAYLQQAVRLRPHDGELLVDVGDQWAARGVMQPALECWFLAFQSRGDHRRQVARRLAGQIPFAILAEDLAPQWDTLPEFWRIVRAAAPADVPVVLAYAEREAQREAADATPQRAGDLWRALADMQREAGSNDAALVSLARSCQASPESYDSRRLLGLALYEAGRYAEGDEHLRWCLDRSPDDGVIKQALMGAGRERYATEPGTVR
jgi:tetratricopeptide (TPR) repeat protein